MMDKLIKLRRELHQHPELSQQESKTAERIVDFISKQNPNEIITGIGGHGVAACYEFGQQGPVIAIRCELDALPIQEDNTFGYQSEYKGISHKCGHDGHMTMVAGLSFWLHEQTFKQGKVILLFQPAEETGKGAEQVLLDRKFTTLNIDYLFALHNIPGEEMHSVITMDNGFSAEVISFKLTLEGLESHAAEPEQGVNPSLAIASLVKRLDKLNIRDPNDSAFAVLTPVHIKMGEEAYGISPAKGELHYTIRTWDTKNMEELKSSIVNSIEEECLNSELNFNLDWLEHFPSADNDQECNSLIADAVEKMGGNQIARPFPFKFGEDFGWFSKQYKTGMFGLGAGVHTPSLHNKEYDFPDELIQTGVDMFKEIVNIILLRK